MKTEVKFRELPEKVQKFIGRIFGIRDPFTVQLNWLHNIEEWKDATDGERLAYAEWRYPVGTKFKSVFSNEIDIIKTVFVSVLTDGDVDSDCELEDGRIIYDHFNNKWAEIISEPEEKQSIKDRLKGTCVKNKSVEMGAEIVALYVEAGIANEHKLEGIDVCNAFYGEKDGVICCGLSEYFTSVLTLDQLRQIVRGEEKRRPGESINEYRKRVIGLGPIKEASPSAQQEFLKANPGMQHVEEPKAGDMVEVDTIREYGLCEIVHIKGSKVWLHPQDHCDFVVDISQISLPQKSEVESKAKEILNYYNNQFSEFYKEGEQRTKQMILTAIKWGQANPGKI